MRRHVTTPAALVLTGLTMATAMRAEVMAGDPSSPIDGFSIDSRTLAAGDLFLAIRGDRLDGHRFVGEALRKGACGVVVSDATVVPPTAAGSRAPLVLRVDETTRALQRLGQYVRRASGAQVVAITGSAGKTTTKELTAAALSARYRVFRSTGNLNNHIGVPLSLLELRRRPEVGVLELGMSAAGEIRLLVGLAEPDVRVWTNVAEVHSAFFPSIEAIADAKAEVLAGATAGTTLVANAADPRVMARTAGFPGRTITFGIDVAADVSASDVSDLGLDGSRATLRTPAGQAELRIRLLGRGNLANALAAIGVALRFEVPLDLALGRVAAAGPAARRGEVLRLPAGPTVIDDSYNSNPTAVERALEPLSQDRTSRRRIAVLGEMLELGERAVTLHQRCGQAAAGAGLDALVTVGGPAARALADAAIAAGMATASVMHCDTSDEAADVVARLARSGDLVLVKGSRGIRTDRVVDRLKAEFA